VLARRRPRSVIQAITARSRGRQPSSPSSGRAVRSRPRGHPPRKPWSWCRAHRGQCRRVRRARRADRKSGGTRQGSQRYASPPKSSLPGGCTPGGQPGGITSPCADHNTARPAILVFLTCLASHDYQSDGTLVRRLSWAVFSARPGVAGTPLPLSASAAGTAPATPSATCPCLACPLSTQVAIVCSELEVGADRIEPLKGIWLACRGPLLATTRVLVPALILARRHVHVPLGLVPISGRCAREALQNSGMTFWGLKRRALPRPFALDRVAPVVDSLLPWSPLFDVHPGTSSHHHREHRSGSQGPR